MKCVLYLIILIGIIFFPLKSNAEVGKASYYSYEFGGRKTANGEIFNPQELTAAHRSLPFDTEVLVKNLSNGKEVVVRINDRGPFVPGRIIDLSKAAAEKLDIIQSGIAEVEIERIVK